MMLTQERLKQIVLYDPSTGEFTNLVRRGGLQVGQKIGWVNGKGYRHMSIDGRTYRANRLAWFYVHGEWPVDQVDHKNRNKMGDAFSNLRAASNAQNARNSKVSKRNTSGVKGVMWYKRHGRWTASIRVDRKLLHLGYFDDFAAAVGARRSAEQRHFGEFAA